MISVNLEKVKLKMREVVIMYQNECFIVLHHYWHKGVVTNPRTGSF